MTWHKIIWAYIYTTSTNRTMWCDDDSSRILGWVVGRDDNEEENNITEACDVFFSL